MSYDVDKEIRQLERRLAADRPRLLCRYGADPLPSWWERHGRSAVFVGINIAWFVVYMVAWIVVGGVKTPEQVVIAAAAWLVSFAVVRLILWLCAWVKGKARQLKRRRGAA